MGQIVGYARVSTSGQKIEQQIQLLEKNGVEKIFQEKKSGVNTERLELNNLLNYVRSGDTVLVCKLDRISRSTKHLLEMVEFFEKNDITFKVININFDTSTPTGKFMITMLGSVAEFEREMMLERQREGIALAKSLGKYKGRKPTARAKKDDVVKLIASGLTRQRTAELLDIGVSSVYRILKEMKK